jgi:hypothetical protein
MKRLACWVSTCLVLMSVAVLSSCGGSSGVKLVFPGGSALAIDLGQNITINVTATNDGGQGVTWTCTGAACTTLANVTTTSVTFNATGATGTATITATSIKDTSVTKSVTITVNAQLNITTTQGQLTAATAGQAYSFSFTATGGSGTLTWSASGLSDGLSINTGTGAISGTPTAHGTVTFTVTVKDSSAAGSATFTTATLTITVNNPAAPAITTTQAQLTAAPATAGTAYAGFTFSATGTGTLTWSATGLPSDNLSLSTAGVLSGTPTSKASIIIMVTVSDTYGQSSPATPFTITVNNPAAPAITTTQAQVTAAPASAGTLYTFTFHATGTGTLTWSATGLPSDNLSLSTTGVLSGTPTSQASINIMVTVSDTYGQSSPATPFTVTVDSAPAITSANNTTFTAGTAGTFTVTTTGFPTPSLSETGGLPSGVTFVDNGNGTATLSGTPAAGTGGTYSITIKATNTVATTPQTFTLTVNQAPVFTSANNTTFSLGAPGTFTVTATGPPTPSFTETGALPSGVTLVDNGNGTATLSGTPAAGTAGTYSITLKATNTVATTSQAFTLTVNNAPGFTSANNTTFTVGTAGTFTVTTTGTPTASLTETGALPSGVTFVDNGNGTATLSGTPAAATGGTYPITINAKNSVGTTPQTFTLTVDQAPAITSANNVTFTVGALGTFTVTTTGTPKPSLSDNGATLPSGVTFVDNGNGTGTLSGTPASGTGGTYSITFTANNGVGSAASQSFTLTVNLAPVFSTGTSTTFTAGTAGTFTVTVTGTPTPSLSETGALPSGVTFVDNGNGTATLSGTPAASTGGTYQITINAKNSVGTTPQTFTLTVDQAPVITSANNITFNVGSASTFTVTTSGYPVPSLSDNSAALPSGVTFVDNGDGTGTLSGTPAAGTAGSYSLTFTASNGIGSSANQSFTLTVGTAPPCGSGSESLLDGQYAFLLQGFTGTGTGTPTIIAASFAANGSGGITGGDEDINTFNNANHYTIDNTSTYSVGSDHRGCLTIVNSNSTTSVFRFNLGGISSGKASKGWVIEFDETTGAGTHITGPMRLQDTTSFSLSKLKARYAIGVDGWDMNNSMLGHFALIGSFTVNTSGTISNGFADANDSGTLFTAITGATGSIGTISATTGRATGSYVISGTTTFDYAFYMISANEIFIISTDNNTNLPVASGRAIVTGSSFNNNSVSGNYILHATGNDNQNSGPTGVSDVVLALLNLNGGTLTGTSYEYEENGLQSPDSISGSYSIASPSGRVTVSGTGGNHQPVIYVTTTPTDGISAFFEDTGGSANFGAIEAQPNQTYSVASLAASNGGVFFFGNEDPGDNTAQNELDEATIASNGGVTDIADEDNPQGTPPLEADQTNTQGAGFFTMGSNGVGTVASGGSGGILMTNGTRIFAIFNTDDTGEITIGDQ